MSYYDILKNYQKKKIYIYVMFISQLISNHVIIISMLLGDFSVLMHEYKYL